MAEYKMVRLGDVCEIQSGGTPSRSKTEYWKNGTIPWVKIGDFSEKYLNKTTEHITQKGLENSSAKLFSKGTILYSIFATLGEATILNIDATTNQAIAGIKIKDKSSIDIDYLFAYLKSLKEEVNRIGRGVAQNNINLSILKAFTFPLPPLETQKQIAKQLNKCTTLLANHKRMLEKYDTLIKSRFIEMFGDPLENNKKWDSKKLENLCEIVRGGSPRPIDKFLGGAIPWIKIGDATIGDDIFLYKTKEHIIEDGIKKSRLISEGSLIFANCGVSLGFARIIKFQGCIHDGWLAFQNIDASINNIFLLKSINMCTDYFRRTAPDGTQPNLNTTIMKNFVQIIPPIKLQEEYVSFVQQIDKSKFAVQKSLEKAEILYKSLMQQYFA